MIRINVGEFTFLFGSVVFFVAMLLAVFLSYVFDGTHSGQLAIVSAVLITVLTPLAAYMTGYQMKMPGTQYAYELAQPSLRIHWISALAMLLDFIAMTILWQYLANRPNPLPLYLRVFASLLTALWVDVAIFTSAVFYSDPAFLGILWANFTSRLILVVLVSPLVTLYVGYEVRRHGLSFARRPLLAILGTSARTEHELSLAQQEVARRTAAEHALADQLHFNESLLAAIPYPVFYKDNAGRYMGGNKAFHDHMGGDPDRFVGKTATELFPPEVASAYNAEDERLLAQPGVHTFETVSHRPDGEAIDVILCKSTFLDSTGQTAGTLGVIIDITERKQLEIQLEEMAMRDPLTGALNRRSFIIAVNEEIERTERYGGGFSVIILDADKFKTVNDRHGHATGDEVLRRIVGVCKDVCRDSDLVSRLGGEEFAVLMLHANLEVATALAERLRVRLGTETFESSAGIFHVTASFGVADFAAPRRTADELLHHADLAMYAAKKAGGDRVHTAS